MHAYDDATTELVYDIFLSYMVYRFVRRQLACMLRLLTLTHGAGGVRAAVERGMRPEPLGLLRLDRGGHGQREGEGVSSYSHISSLSDGSVTHTQFARYMAIEIRPTVIYWCYISQTREGQCAHVQCDLKMEKKVCVRPVHGAAHALARSRSVRAGTYRYSAG